jgi:hypothetical protein
MNEYTLGHLLGGHILPFLFALLSSHVCLLLLNFIHHVDWSQIPIYLKF